MARQLMEKGRKVALLAILDSQVRGLPGYREALSTPAYAHFVAKTILEKIKYRLGYSRKQRLPGAVGNLGQRNSEPPDQNEIILGDVAEEEVPGYMRAVMQANLKALQRYVPKSYPGKLTLFKSQNHGQGVHYGWGELVRGGVETYFVPGTHRGILQEPNVGVLADQMQVCIDRASEGL
jgi:aspartate racemase